MKFGISPRKKQQKILSLPNKKQHKLGSPNKKQHKLHIAPVKKQEKAQIAPVKKKLKIVAISDNHANYLQMNKILQMSGDIFIHAGDFTDYGKEEDFVQFFNFLDKLKFTHKIVISGNHEISLDNGCISNSTKQFFLSKFECRMSKQQIVDQLKKRCVYLQHEMVQIQKIKIFGSPYSCFYVGNAFQYLDEYQNTIWEQIPDKLDILVTHSPPYKILDKSSEGNHGGSIGLREQCFKKRPKYHIFGHIHQSAGKYQLEGIQFLNVSNLPTKIQI